jgi:hypothetical protein
MEEYVKMGILITCFKSPLGFRFYFKDLNTDYIYNPLTYESIDRGDGSLKNKTIIPHYDTFEDGLTEMKKQADIYLKKR